MFPQISMISCLKYPSEWIYEKLFCIIKQHHSCQNCIQPLPEVPQFFTWKNIAIKHILFLTGCWWSWVGEGYQYNPAGSAGDQYSITNYAYGKCRIRLKFHFLNLFEIWVGLHKNHLVIFSLGGRVVSKGFHKSSVGFDNFIPFVVM